MADIAAAAQKINDIEVSQDAPITEALLTKFGGNINYLLDLGISVVTFNSSQSWSAPSGVNNAILIGCGGGQGGNIDVGGTWTGTILGGWGARGSVQYYPITPGGSYSVSIGAGGAGANGGGFSPYVGLAGGNSSIIGPSGAVIFPAGYGGVTGGSFEAYATDPNRKTQGIAPTSILPDASATTGFLLQHDGGQSAYTGGYNTLRTSGGPTALFLGGGAGYFGSGGGASDGLSPAISGAANTGAGGGAGRATYPGGSGGSGKIIAILFK